MEHAADRALEVVPENLQVANGGQQVRRADLERAAFRCRGLKNPRLVSTNIAKIFDAVRDEGSDFLRTHLSPPRRGLRVRNRSRSF